MNIGSLALFQSFGYDESVTDSQVYKEELRLAEQLEDLGYDWHCAVEHHFEDYSFCPDNTVYLSHIAAITKNLKLATTAVILPWNEPLRVAEKIALLDELSNGRVIFGMGRGLSRREYNQFGVELDDSRERFDEAAPMILKALEDGFIEGSGPHFNQPRAVIRPTPTKSFKGRVTQVAMSPDSALEAATHAAQIMIFNQKDIKEHYEDIQPYRKKFTQLHGCAPPPPLMATLSVCHQDKDKAAELARKHIAGYLVTVMHHYELAGEHFKNAKGYEAYGEAVDMLQDIGLEGLAESYMNAQAWGTPQQMLDKLEAWHDVMGDFDLMFGFRHAGIAYADAENSMRLVAKEVIPEVRRWMDSTKAA